MSRLFGDRGYDASTVWQVSWDHLDQKITRAAESCAYYVRDTRWLDTAQQLAWQSRADRLEWAAWQRERSELVGLLNGAA